MSLAAVGALCVCELKWLADKHNDKYTELAATVCTKLDHIAVAVVIAIRHSVSRSDDTAGNCANCSVDNGNGTQSSDSVSGNCNREHEIPSRTN